MQHTVVLPGLCEPSAAVQGPFGDIWVADDDQDDRLYTLTPNELAPRTFATPRDQDGAAVKDLEGLTFDRTGNLWMMGSHSRSGSGKLGRRARLVSMDPSAPGTAPIQQGSLWPAPDTPSPTALVAQLLAVCPTCAPDGDWASLDFEGLTMEPGTDALLLGARAPLLADGQAWLAAVEPGDGFAVKRVHAVALGNRGVRDLAPSPTDSGVWILAGPPGSDQGEGFALYSWQPGEDAKLLALLPAVEGAPEGLWPVDAHSAWLFIDEGTRLKRDALDSADSAHRRVKKSGKVKFECGAAVPEGGTDAWAHALQIRWQTNPAIAPTIR